MELSQGCVYLVAGRVVRSFIYFRNTITCSKVKGQGGERTLLLKFSPTKQYEGEHERWKCGEKKTKRDMDGKSVNTGIKEESTQNVGDVKRY